MSALAPCRFARQEPEFLLRLGTPAGSDSPLENILLMLRFLLICRGIGITNDAAGNGGRQLSQVVSRLGTLSEQLR